MTTLMLVSFIDQVNSGTEFKRSRWPLHVTLVPWMDVSRFNTFIAGLELLAKKVTPVQCRVGGIELFGRDKNLPVNIIESGGKLNDVHAMLLDFCSRSSVLRSWRFLGSEYKPHITQYDGRGVSEGDDFTVDNISVIEIIDPSTCRIMEKYEL